MLWNIQLMVCCLNTIILNHSEAVIILKIMKLAVGSNLFQGFKALFRSNVLFRLIVTFFIIIIIVLYVLIILIFLFWVENERHMAKILCCRRKNVPQTFKIIVILKCAIGKYHYITYSYLVKIRSP